MELTISGVDHAPEELQEQTPLIVDLVRELPGDDRPDYWLARLRTPIRWIHENQQRYVNYLVLAARWEDTRIELGVASLPVGIAFVTDESLLDDARLDFGKCHYAAIGFSHETTGGDPAKDTRNILTGTIAPSFGMGKR